MCTVGPIKTSEKNSIFENEMINAPFTYHKVKQMKWLLTVTFLFSFFTFSGYPGHYQSRQQATQTELVISNVKTCKRTISYKKAIEPNSSNHFLINPFIYRADTLYAYNKLTHVKLTSVTRQSYSTKSFHRFLQVKTIPQSSDEDILVSFTG